MNLEKFVKTIEESVQKKLGNDYQVTVRKEIKNNGVPYLGLHVKRDGLNMGPVIYLNNYFQMYESGSIILGEAVDSIIRTVRSRNPSVDMRQFLNYESVRQNIVYRLINTEKNRELLEDIPHIEFMDLSIIFQYLILEEEQYSASVLIHNVHMKLWDVTVEKLYQEAKENTQRLEQYEIKSMEETLCSIMGAESPGQYDHDECMKEFSGSVPMYVLSNKHMIYGAACMLYPNLIRDLADEVDSSLYIIPSSTHEVLLLPTEHNEDSNEIKAMIKEINDTQVAPEEVLSYSLYYYDKAERKIIML